MRSTKHVDSHCLGEDPWNCPGCREEMRAELGVRKPADYPETQAVIDAAENVVAQWRGDISRKPHIGRLRDALAAWRRASE